MIFYEIVEQDFKVGDYIKETTVPELTYQITGIGPKTSSDYSCVTVAKHFMITSYGIPIYAFNLITKDRDVETIKCYMCGEMLHAKLIKP